MTMQNQEKTTSMFVVHADQQTLFQAAAEEFSRIVADAISKRGKCFVALAGGSTPRELYRLLAGPTWRARVTWEDIDFFFGDERCVAPEHADSNYRMAREALFANLNIPSRNIHRMKGEDEPRQAAQAYEQETMNVFEREGNERPRFDLVLLGLGEDGHTASLFPGTSALNENERLVAANYVEKFKSYRLTMTLPLLNNSREILFLVSGESKAAIIEEIFKNTKRSFQYPAELVQPNDGKVLWFLDRAAVSALQNQAS